MQTTVHISGGARVAVIGGGLCGLTAAYRLQRAGHTVQVLESGALPGGRVRSVRRGGYIIDIGASALADTYAAYLQLVDDLGLRTVPSAPAVGIFRGGKVHLLRLDRMIRSGLTTPLLSPRSKVKALRLGLDVLVASRRGQLDYSDMRKAAPLDTESARDYAERTLNAEIDAYLCEPIVRTMLIEDTDVVSRVELFSGLANIFSAAILSLEGGQGALTEALAQRLDVACDARVEAVGEDGCEVVVRYVAGEAEIEERFDAAVVTCPLSEAVRICPQHRAELSPLSEGLGYTKCLKVAVATTRPPECPAFLVQLSSKDDADIALLFLDHNKAPDRAPAGRGLIDACWSGRGSARMFAATDDEITARTLETIDRVFPELRGAVDFVEITRWEQALPLTGIGAYRKIGAFNAELDPHARVQFGGDYMSAAGQNTAVEFGTRAAKRIDALLRAYPPLRVR